MYTPFCAGSPSGACVWLTRRELLIQKSVMVAQQQVCDKHDTVWRATGYKDSKHRKLSFAYC